MHSGQWQASRNNSGREAKKMCYLVSIDLAAPLGLHDIERLEDATLE